MAPTGHSLRDDALAIWRAGVRAVDAAELVRRNVSIDDEALVIAGTRLPLKSIDRLVVVGGGKAGAGMAAGLEAALDVPQAERLKLTGWLNVPADCVLPLRYLTLHAARPAGRNEPTEAGVEGTRRILELVGGLGPRDLCLCLLSGGGSALLPAPGPGVTLEDKQRVTRCLSGAGANIQQLNTVRKRLSAIKGGGLARACRAGQLWTLIISDVLGDPLDIIASGPTVPDTGTAAEALAILQVGGRAADLPSAVFDLLEQQVEAQQARSVPSTPTAEDWTTEFGCRVRNVVIGNNAVAVDAAAAEARRLGYEVTAEAARQLEGQAEEIGRSLVARARQLRAAGRRAALITGGEPVVKLAPVERRGKGGRNQQLVLAALLEAANDRQLWNNIALLSGGTDGEDGPTDAAGAVVDAAVALTTQQQQLDAADALSRNDAYEFFKPLGALLRTGPTHTNVCDLRIVVVDGSEPTHNAD